MFPICNLVDYYLEGERCVQVQRSGVGGQGSEDRGQGTEGREDEAERQRTEGRYQIIEDGVEVWLTKEKMKGKLKEFIDKAERLLNETGYHQRDEELRELRNDD